jgi:hypothetical protein
MPDFRREWFFNISCHDDNAMRLKKTSGRLGVGAICG